MWPVHNKLQKHALFYFVSNSMTYRVHARRTVWKSHVKFKAWCEKACVKYDSCRQETDTKNSFISRAYMVKSKELRISQLEMVKESFLNAITERQKHFLLSIANSSRPMHAKRDRYLNKVVFFSWASLCAIDPLYTLPYKNVRHIFSIWKLRVDFHFTKGTLDFLQS